MTRIQREGHVVGPVEVEKMAAGGDGLGRLADGRVVFVDGALPGERVHVRLVDERRDFARAVVEEIAGASPHRVPAPCPHRSAGCGGCRWQHIDPRAQLEWKREIVVDALRRTGRMPDAEVVSGGSVPPWGYRSSLRLAVAGDGRVGLREERSHRVVPLPDCPVAVPELSAVLDGLRVRGAEEVSLRVGVASGDVTAWTGTANASIEGLPDRARVGAEAIVREHVAGVDLRVSAASFFQSGPAAAELLVSTVRAACADALSGAPWIDAFGGVGLFAATLSRDHVGSGAVVVESSPSACADARVNVPAAEVVESRFERWRPASTGAAVGLVVADPARAGLGAEGVDVVVATGASRVVLVSCDPVAAARDARLLVGHGFRHSGATVLDLFPQTPHVEVVTRFDR